MRSRWGYAIGGLCVAAVLALFVSPFASSSPDGLERVAADEGFLDTASGGQHGLEYGPLTGVLGLLVVFAVVSGAIALAAAPAAASVSSGHHDHEHLYIDGDGAIHRLAPQVKVAGAISFLLTMVLIPRGAWALLAVAAALVAGLVVAARLPIGTVISRLAIEVPFLGFALLMPLFGSGPEVEVLGITLRADGIEAGATLLAKGTLGVVVAVVLAATTTVPEILTGLRRLHVPAALVLVMQLMLSYLDVVLDDARRMQRARQARGYEPRWLRQAGAFAAGLGSLFVRSYERGERVHRAMLARGFTGELP